MTKNMTPNPMQPRRVFGADEDAPYFVGRKLYWTEVKEAAPGFLPDGLIVQTYNGRYVVQGGVLRDARQFYHDCAGWQYLLGGETRFRRF